MISFVDSDIVIDVKKDDNPVCFGVLIGTDKIGLLLSDDWGKEIKAVIPYSESGSFFNSAPIRCVSVDI